MFEKQPGCRDKSYCIGTRSKIERINQLPRIFIDEKITTSKWKDVGIKSRTVQQKIPTLGRCNVEKKNHRPTD